MYLMSNGDLMGVKMTNKSGIDKTEPSNSAIQKIKDVIFGKTEISVNTSSC